MNVFWQLMDSKEIRFFLFLVFFRFYWFKLKVYLLLYVRVHGQGENIQSCMLSFARTQIAKISSFFLVRQTGRLLVPWPDFKRRKILPLDLSFLWPSEQTKRILAALLLPTGNIKYCELFHARKDCKDYVSSPFFIGLSFPPK